MMVPAVRLVLAICECIRGPGTLGVALRCVTLNKAVKFASP